MSSYNQFSTRRRTIPALIFRVLIIIGVVIVVWLIARTIIRRVVTHVPLLSKSSVYSTLTSKRILVDRVIELETTVAAYDAELVRARLTVTENDALKRELNRTPRPTGTLAHVLTLPNRSFYDTFVIDAGSTNGLHAEQTVYAFNAIAIGTISDVTEHTATVMLYSAPGRTTSGSVTGSEVAVTLIGRGGGEYEVRMPRDVHFEVGGLIAHQSTESIVLAQIERIATDPRDPFQKLYAKAPVNLQALKWVIVR